METGRQLAGRPAMGGTLGRPAMANTLAYLYLAGATLGLASVALPHGPGTNVPALLAIIGLAFVVGAVLLLGARRLPESAIPAFLALGSLTITAAIYFDGHGASAYAFFYVWVGVEAFYFLSRWQASLQLLLVGAAYAWVLSVAHPESVPLQRWLLTIGTVVVAGLIVAYMRDRIERLVHRLTDAARTDPLTGLLNRRAFEELFELELERARRGGRNLSVLVGDLDGFKQVNDRLGHAAGDAALERLAADLEKWKRRIDAAARVGGEEFALLLPETDERGAFLVAERLRRAVLRTFSDDPLPITISFGLASWPEHGDDPELLMRAADQALYAAKDLGRDRSVIYSAEVASMLGRGSDDGEIQLATVVSLAEALDIRDTGTAQHSQTVGRYARLMAEELGLTPDRVERIRVAGILHDVGKIGIADGVLTKPGPLDDEEWTEMRTHPQIAARLLARPEFSDLRSWILAHHERLDGSGYPEGLSDEEIPLEARVLAVADAFEAMTADRVYRSALGEEAARAELEAGVGSQFDAEVVDAFLRALDREGQPDAPAVTN
jgi:diguanylate cyclase (GGDEF)-like protein